MLRTSLVLKRTIEDRFDLLQTPSHTHILVQDLEGLHNPQLPIFELLVSNRVRNIAQLRSVTMKILQLLNSTQHRVLLRWSTVSTTPVKLVSRSMVSVLDLHQVKQVLRVRFTLQPQLILFHSKNRL